MKMKEDQVRSYINRRMAMKISQRGAEKLCIADLLADGLTCLYPYVRDVSVDKFEKFNRAVKCLEEIRKDKTEKKLLDSLNEDSLRRALSIRWINRIENTSSILSEFGLVDSIGQDGVVAIKQKLYDGLLRSNSGRDNAAYGTKEMTVKELQLNNNSQISIVQPQNSNEDVQVAEAEDSFNAFWKSNNLPTELKEGEYFWQFKLSNKLYQEIKNHLKALHLGNQNARFIRKYAFQISLFLSEWFKREYNGNDRNTGLGVIGLLASQSSEYIWEGAKLPDLYLINTGENERVMSLYVLGGLPIQYANNNTRFEDLVNAISEFAEADIDSEQEEVIIDCFDAHNSVYRQSLEKGSWNQYVRTLMEYVHSENECSLPFAADDIDSDPFYLFVKNIKEGYAKGVSNRYFTKELKVWTTDTYESVDSTYRINIGFINSYNIIRNRDLELLGVRIPNDVSYFTLRLKSVMNDGSEHYGRKVKRYNRIGNDVMDFCGGWGASLEMPIDLFSTKKLELVLQQEKSSEEIIVASATYEIPNHIELYETNDAYCWSTLTNNANRKVLLINNTIYNVEVDTELIQAKSSQTSIDSWAWIYQNEPLSLTNRMSGETLEIGINGYKNIVVDFRNSTLPQNIQLNSRGEVNCDWDEEQVVSVPIVFLTEKRNVPQNLSVKCDGYAKKEMANIYLFEYKEHSSGNYNYKVWDDNHAPSQGLLWLRITCKNQNQRKTQWKKLVFFAPSTRLVERNLESHKIEFGLTDVYCDDSNGERQLLSNGVYEDSTDDFTNKDTLTFFVGKENPIRLEVFRAFRLYEIYRGEVKIKSYFDLQNVNIPIPSILREQNSIRTIAENGVKKIHVHPMEYMDFCVAPETNLMVNRTIKPGIYQTIFTPNFEDRTTTSVKSRGIELDEECNCLILKVSERYSDQYRFFFWSGRTSNSPIELYKEKIGERQYRMQLPKIVTEEAMVFQSLKDCSPNLYFRPFYLKRKYSLLSDRVSSQTTEYIMKCYDLAVEHRTYFFTFPVLKLNHTLYNHTKFLLDFFRLHNNSLNKDDIPNLQRLAYETGFDWFFLNRRIVMEYRRNLSDKEKNLFDNSIEKLLLKSPLVKDEYYYARRFVSELYTYPTPENCRTIINRFLTYVCAGIGDRENRIKFLNTINAQHTLFSQVCQRLKIV